MKTNFLGLLCLVLLLAGSTVSAQKKKKSRKEKKCISLVDALAENSILVDAVNATGLLPSIVADGPFTIFAPSDKAFVDAVEGLGTTLEELVSQTDSLAGILLYHVLAEPKSAEELQKEKSVETVLLEEMAPCGVNTVSLKAKKKKVTVNGGFTSAKVLEADVETCESTIIHFIDSILLPCEIPSGEGRASGSG